VLRKNPSHTRSLKTRKGTAEMTPEQEREMQELDVEIQIAEKKLRVLGIRKQIAETELAIVELQQSLKEQLKAETARKAAVA